MNNKRPARALFLICSIIPFLLHGFSGNSCSFETAEEYISHAENSDKCVNRKCHGGLIPGRDRYQHEPLLQEQCIECHRAEAYPERYGLDARQDKVCFRCHGKLKREVNSSMFVHGPLENGDCTSCHDPHGSEQRYFLKKAYGDLCSVCHTLKGLYRGESVHKPVRDGNCGLCHDVHASNYKSRLTDYGANLCLSCHEDMVKGMTSDYVHRPLVESGCTDCHDPHSGEDSLRLKASSEQLCFSCHESKLNEIKQYDYVHKPAVKGLCLSCHSPHYSEKNYLLLDNVDNLCYKCHREKMIWKKRRFQHGPVVQGNCTACHNPHGSDNAFILRLSFPHKFYTSYSEGKYDLCFNCHKEALVTEEETETVTNFRNGDINLHRLHVNQKKGRTCRACHDIHASDQYDHLREEFLFGSVNIPIYYFKTETGGSCIPGCHRERAYDRVEKVKNN